MCRHWTRWSAEISMKVQSRRMVRFMFRAMNHIGGGEPDGRVTTSNTRVGGLGDDEVDDRYTPVVDRDIRHVIAAR
jgi:hypothetical protein